MAGLPLPTPERLRQLLRYEPETGKLYWRDRIRGDFPDLRSFRIFQSYRAGKEAFTADKGNGYLQGTVERRTFVGHRAIWAIVTGEWPTGYIDHINHDRMDNRWVNLRMVSPQGNARNQPLRRDNKTGRVGVRWHEASGAYIAIGRIAGKTTQLLYTRDFDAACAARAKYEREYGYHENHGS